jgi:hypothetical protein
MSRKKFLYVFAYVAGGLGIPSRDTLALARLYAVKTLAESCQDPTAALAWLQQNQLKLNLNDKQVGQQDMESCRGTCKAWDG